MHTLKILVSSKTCTIHISFLKGLAKPLVCAYFLIPIMLAPLLYLANCLGLACLVEVLIVLLEYFVCEI